MPRQLIGFAAAVRLGWAVSSNWTRPILFVTYAVLRPISVALILAVMYSVITHNAAAARPYLAFLIIGTAFWSFIQEGVSEFATGILEDRGRYHILKYTYMAPLGFPLFLVGRATSKLASAAASVFRQGHARSGRFRVVSRINARQRAAGLGSRAALSRAAQSGAASRPAPILSACRSLSSGTPGRSRRHR